MQFLHGLCAGLKRHSDTSPLGKESLGKFIWSNCELFFIDEYSSIQRTYNANREIKAMKKWGLINSEKAIAISKIP